MLTPAQRRFVAANADFVLEHRSPFPYWELWMMTGTTRPPQQPQQEEEEGYVVGRFFWWWLAGVVIVFAIIAVLLINFGKPTAGGHNVHRYAPHSVHSSCTVP